MKLSDKTWRRSSPSRNRKLKESRRKLAEAAIGYIFSSLVRFISARISDQMRHIPLAVTALALVAGCVSSPPDRWDEVRVGMSYEEVIGLVGKPLRRVSQDEGICGAVWIEGGETYVWVDPQAFNSAAFVDGVLMTRGWGPPYQTGETSPDGLAKC